MPYKKKYSSGARKGPYRRRPYRRGYKRFYKKFNKPKYDGAVAVKCFNVDPVVYESIYSSAYFITGWG